MPLSVQQFFPPVFRSQKMSSSVLCRSENTTHLQRNNYHVSYATNHPCGSKKCCINSQCVSSKTVQQFLRGAHIVIDIALRPMMWEFLSQLPPKFHFNNSSCLFKVRCHGNVLAPTSYIHLRITAQVLPFSSPSPFVSIGPLYAGQ